jgi:exopolysaccharide biosynthesis polyprenyl glycosylphosphotransferase
MAQTLLRLLPMEMAILGLIEFSVLFALIFSMLSVGDAAALLQTAQLPADCLILTAMLAVTIVGTAASIGMYRPTVCLDRRRIILTGTVSALLAFPAILIVGGAWRMTLTPGHVLWLARLIALWLGTLLAFRLGFYLLSRWRPVTRNVVIVGSGIRAEGLHRLLSTQRQALFRPVGHAANIVNLEKSAIMDALGGARPWGIVIAADEPRSRGLEALRCQALLGVPVLNEVTFQERHLGRIEPETAAEAGWDPVEVANDTAWSLGIKRGLDIVVATLLCLLTLPLMIVTAIVIRFDSEGPILYRQERTGLHGESFTLFKFRSMTVNAEKNGQAQWAQRHDPRVTRVGAFIRASRIDELPQLFNVLRGEMSMIGPRPERPMFVRQLAEAIPCYNHREVVKPGLTGWAQVNFPYGASVEDAREKLAYDLYYVKHRGLLLDMITLLATIRVILFREGAR